jgi:hypothetical protein
VLRALTLPRADGVPLPTCQADGFSSCEVLVSSLDDVRHALLALHRVLLASERVRYERVHGRTSAGQFLDAVIHAPELAWLQPMTALIVRFDEELEDTPPATEDADAIAELRALLTPNASGATFQQRYAAALAGDAEVVLAHAALMRLLPK